MATYACRRCRTTLFRCEDLESHEAARKPYNGMGKQRGFGCSSYFLNSSAPSAEELIARAVGTEDGISGKLVCPKSSCGSRIGSFNWSGEACSCGAWVTPAVQVVKSKVDEKKPLSALLPTETVVVPRVVGETVLFQRRVAAHETQNEEEKKQDDDGPGERAGEPLEEKPSTWTDQSSQDDDPPSISSQETERETEQIGSLMEKLLRSSSVVHFPSEVCRGLLESYIASDFQRLEALLAQEVTFDSPKGVLEGKEKTMQLLRLGRQKLAASTLRVLEVSFVAYDKACGRLEVQTPTQTFVLEDTVTVRNRVVHNLVRKRVAG